MTQALSLVDGPGTGMPGNVQKDGTVRRKAETSALRRGRLKFFQINSVWYGSYLESLQFLLAQSGRHPLAWRYDTQVFRASHVTQTLLEPLVEEPVSRPLTPG